MPNWQSIKDFFTNAAANKTDTPVKAPAFSLTKVGVAAMFLTAFFSGLAGLIGPLNNGSTAVVSGTFDVTKIAVVVGGVIAIADIVVRGLPPIFQTNRRSGGPSDKDDDHPETRQG